MFKEISASEVSMTTTDIQSVNQETAAVTIQDNAEPTQSSKLQLIS